ncbi:MAG: hypothetical protein RSC41_03045 [Oscillospiraceae bacterium]
MEEWVEVLSKHFDVFQIGRNSIKIKKAAFSVTYECWYDNIVTKSKSPKGGFIYIDRFNFKYPHVYAYLGYKNKEEYCSDEINKH